MTVEKLLRKIKPNLWGWNDFGTYKIESPRHLSDEAVVQITLITKTGFRTVLRLPIQEVLK